MSRNSAQNEASASSEPTSSVFNSLTIDGQTVSCGEDDLVTLEKLGQGRFGVVEKVKLIDPEVVMAVKKLNVRYDTIRLLGPKRPRSNVSQKAEEEATKYIEKEYKDEEMERRKKVHRIDCSLRGPQHANIVKFYGILFWSGQTWICVELMEFTLDQIYQRVYAHNEIIPEQYIRKIAQGVVSGLDHLATHHKITSDDLKPSKILMNRVGNVKVTEFGLTLLITQYIGDRSKDFRVYMSEERMLGTVDDSCSDVWSLGLILLEIAIGKYPYELKSNLFQQLWSITSEPAPTVPSDRFSVEFQCFITSCLNKNVEERANYQQLIESDFLNWTDLNDVDMAAFICHVADELPKP